MRRIAVHLIKTEIAKPNGPIRSKRIFVALEPNYLESIIGLRQRQIPMGDKVNGLISDHANVLLDVEKPPGSYGSGTGRRRDADEGPKGLVGSPVDRAGSSGGTAGNKTRSWRTDLFPSH